jgi:hypothetical protein
MGNVRCFGIQDLVLRTGGSDWGSYLAQVTWFDHFVPFGLVKKPAEVYAILREPDATSVLTRGCHDPASHSSSVVLDLHALARLELASTARDLGDRARMVVSNVSHADTPGYFGHWPGTQQASLSWSEI